MNEGSAARDPRSHLQLELEDLSVLDWLPYSTAWIDTRGEIVAVNESWRRFGRDNGADAATSKGLGQNYFKACRDRATTGVASACDGVREVAEGRRPGFELIYSCHAPAQMRWFRLLARPMESKGPYGKLVAVTHIDVTDFYMANAHSRIQMGMAKALSSRVSMLTACRDLALSVCHELDWDYAGVWTLDPSSWTMRCRDTWSRPELGLTSFEQASRTAALGPGIGLPGRAWTASTVQWATDVDAAGPAEGIARVMPPSALTAGFRTALAFPLKCDGDVLAVVDLFSRVRRPPEEALVELLEASGDQLALWELRDRAEECSRAAQQEADDARARLESVLDCAPAFVVAVDRDQRIQFINRARPPQRKEDMLGQPWKEYVSPEEHARVEQALVSVFQTGTPQNYELSSPDEAGRPCWFLNHVGPIRSGSGVTGAVIIAQDITEAKLAQSELHDTQRLAAVGTLAAGVAHEINTPIQFVSDSIHFLREAAGDIFALLDQLRELKQAVEEGQTAAKLSQAAEVATEAEEQADLDYLRENVPRAFDRAVEGLERVTSIVRSMKEFAHPAQKEMAPADLNRAISATLTVAKNEYKYVADVETDFGELPQVVCHVNDINQVVLNLVVNAAHAIEDVVRGSERKGLIKIVTRVEGEHVRVAITDTGAGIPEAVRARIFDPFFTTKEVGRGSGQGLAIARTVVREKHDGELSFETDLGLGTTFLIRLPIHGRRATGAAP